MGGPATGRPFFVVARRRTHNSAATFLTKVTRCMVVPVDQADTLHREMLPRLPFVFCRLARNRRGVTNIEYALVVALISTVLVAASNNLGSSLQSALDRTASVLN